MGLSLRGATSGAIDINPPAVAGDNTITLPSNNGSANQFFRNSGTAGIVTYSSMVETSTGAITVAGNITGAGTISAGGSITGASFFGDGSGLSGIDSTKIETGNTNVETIDTGTDGHITATTEGSERLRITSAGRVSIGTTNPGNANLAVVSTGQAAFSIGQNVDGSASNHLGMWYGTGLGSPAGADIFTSNGNMSFWVDGAGGSGSSIEFGNGFGAGIGGATWMTIDSSGDVGIGTDNPDTLLSINGSTSTQKLITLSSGSIKRNNYIGVNGSDNLEIGADEDNEGNDSSIRFRVDGSEALRIGSAGQLGIGGTNYGTSGQVIKSNGSSSAPTWGNTHSFMFYGEQDTSQTVANTTYTAIENLGTNALNDGDSSIAVWDEDVGTLTIGASGAGIWFLSMAGAIDDIQENDYVNVVIGKNGDATDVGTRISAYGKDSSPGANIMVKDSVSCMANLSADDVVRFYVRHNEGTSETTEENRTFAMGYKMN